MAVTLSDLLDIANLHENPDDRATALTEALGQEGVDLTALDDAAATAFDELEAAGSLDPDTIAGMDALVGVLEAVRAQADAVAATEQAARDAADALYARVHPDGETEQDGADESGEAAQDSTFRDAPSVAAEATPVPASTRPGRARVALSRLRSTPTPAARAGVNAGGWSLAAAAGLTDLSPGAVYEADTIINAAAERVTTLAQGVGRAQTPLLTARYQRDPELVCTDNRPDTQVIARAVDQSRLPGGALTADAGWCSPSEIRYEFCPDPTAEGILDIPTVRANRGGIRFPEDPDFSALYTGTGFHYTEAEMAAGVTKPCYTIPCTGWSECRLEVDGICIEAEIPMSATFPELIALYIRRALIAHAHRINAWRIEKMVAGSTPVEFTGTGTPPEYAYGPSATAGVLGILELQAVDLRYAHRLSPTAMVECVGPYWLHAMLRSDLAKRSGVSDFDVTDAQLDAWLAVRGLRVQSVYDWQDGLVDANAGIGGATPATVWPSTVEFLVYPAGAWLGLTNDVIRVDNLYDSGKLSQNKYTALFTEQGVAVCKRCYDSRHISIETCPDGRGPMPVATLCPAA